MLSFFIGLGSIIGVVGWFITKSFVFISVGLLCYLIETIIEWKNLSMSAKKTDIAILVVGCIAGLFIKSIPFWLSGIIALLCYSALLGVFSVFVFILSVKK